MVPASDVSRDGFRAVVFDMDGVLLDSAALHARAFREALAGVSTAAFDYAEIAGLRTDDAMRRLLAAAGVSVEEPLVAELVRCKRDRYRELAHRAAPLMSGAIETVEALARAGVPVAMASSGSEASVASFLGASGLASVFEFALHGGDVPAAKPSPDIYLLAAARLRLDPAEVLVVEDSTAGAVAAMAAGSAVAAYRAAPATRQALLSHRHFVIDRLLDVVEIARGSQA